MKRYSYTTLTMLTPQQLYRAVADINRWPDWDSELEATSHDGRLEAGTPFMLKPKGGPKVSMTIEKAEEPCCFVDIAHLPLAKMRTSHRFTAEPSGTRIDITIEIRGPLALLWDRVVARKLAAGTAGQTRAFLAHVETMP
jgi:hypothetical protein